MSKSNSEMLDLLFEKKGFKCVICGRKLTPSTAIIDRITPKDMGGSNDISNLQLVCTHCNATNRHNSFFGYQFEAYIKQLLSLHPSYELISDYQSFGHFNSIPDAVFLQKTNHGNNVVIAEIKLATSFTESRIRSIISHLSGNREIVPDAHLVFITPRELPQKYHEMLKENCIELWDKAYLSREFAEQIVSTTPSHFASLFQPDEPENEYDQLIRELKQCSPGKEDWGIYEKLVGKLLERLFCPPLNAPQPQHNDNSKTNRRDFIMPNYSRKNDCWEFLRNRYRADYVVIDAKNSNNYVRKADILQIANYLKKDGTGLFGIIFSRKGVNNSSEYTLREMWLYEGKMIVVLNDTDVEQMLLAKKDGEDPAKLILKKIEDFRLSI